MNAILAQEIAWFDDNSPGELPAKVSELTNLVSFSENWVAISRNV